MAEGETYVVICRQSRRRDECPLAIQQGLHCVECPYVGYILRERNKTSTENSEQTENNDNES